MYPASEKLEIIKIVEQSSSARRWFSLVCLTRGCIHLSVNRTPMSLLRSPAMGLLRRVALVLKTLLSPQGLKVLFTRSSADPGRERYRRAGMTAFTSYIAKGLTMLIGFASVPLTIHYLGAERYGVWLTISSLLLWVALTDFGLAGNALVNVLSEAVGKDDRELARHYTASAFWALVTIAFGIGVVFLAAFHSIPWRAVFRVSGATSTQELELACSGADIVCDQLTVKPATVAL